MSRKKTYNLGNFVSIVRCIALIVTNMMDFTFIKSAVSFHPSGEVVIVVASAEETGVYSLKPKHLSNDSFVSTFDPLSIVQKNVTRQYE